MPSLELTERYNEALTEKNNRLRLFTIGRGTMTDWHTAGAAFNRVEREYRKAEWEDHDKARNLKYDGFALR